MDGSDEEACGTGGECAPSSWCLHPAHLYQPTMFNLSFNSTICWSCNKPSVSICRKLGTDLVLDIAVDWPRPALGTFYADFTLLH